MNEAIFLACVSDQECLTCLRIQLVNLLIAVKMCENNYGYMVPCHQTHNPPIAIAAAPYEDEDYYTGAWANTSAEYVPNNSEQCQLE